MPEGHTLFRLASTLDDHFGHRPLRVSSPQGRFAESAALVDHSRLLAAESHGKHLFLDFEAERTVHVHLGLYGKFTVQRGIPAPPVGQVRMRLVADGADGREPAYGDLRGATACELVSPVQRQAVVDRLGPDPLRPDADWSLAWERVRTRRTPIGALLMDQAVLAGVGNVYRAEVLFRHRTHPLRPGRTLRRGQFQAMWDDLVVLLAEGVERGRIDTVHSRSHPASMAGREVGRARDRHFVYRRDGSPCLVCGSTVRTDVLVARNLFWCPRCQPVFRSRASS